MSLVGIPCAQAVQEASRVTQRRRAPLELLQESKHKTKLKCPRCSFTLHQKNLPPLLTNSTICPPRSQKNTREAHPEWNHRAWTTSSGTSEHELSSWICRAKVRAEQQKKISPHHPSLPTPHLQRHLAGRSWGCPSSLHVGISWGLPSSLSQWLQTTQPGPQGAGAASFVHPVLLMCKLQPTNTSAPSGLPWGLGFSGQPSTPGCRHSSSEKHLAEDF